MDKGKQRYYFRVANDNPDDLPIIYVQEADNLHEALEMAEEDSRVPVSYFELIGTAPPGLDHLALRSRTCVQCGLRGERLVDAFPERMGGLCVDCTEKRLEKDRAAIRELWDAVHKFLDDNGAVEDDDEGRVITSDWIKEKLPIAANNYANKAREATVGSD